MRRTMVLAASRTPEASSGRDNAPNAARTGNAHYAAVSLTAPF